MHIMINNRDFMAPDADYLRKKYYDNRPHIQYLYIVFALVASAFWVWDFNVDPIGARETVVHRLLMLIVLAPYVFFRFSRKINLVAWSSILTVLATEMIYVNILTHLKNGMIYGIGGFMYWLMFSIVGFQCFSYRLNVLFTLTLTSLPHIQALVGWAPGFDHRHYSILIWPGAFAVMLAQYIISIGYLQRYQIEQQLAELTITDPLTGMFNRRHFIPTLEKAFMTARRLEQPYALITLDIDHFKLINDSFGHAAGDLAIQKLVSTCKTQVRQIDSIGRLGGEEFAILLPGADLSDAQQIAERIRKATDESTLVIASEKTIHMTVSLGIAVPVPEDIQADDWLKRCDQAMYRAKISGRNKVSF